MNVRNTTDEFDVIGAMPRVYSARGHEMTQRHGNPTAQIVTADQRRAAKAKRKARRAARKSQR